MSKTTQQIGDTLITIENDSWKIKVILGLGGLVVLVILGFLYRVEAGLIALAIGGAYAAKVGVQVRHQYKLAGYEQRRLQADTERVEAEALSAKARSFFVETNTGVFQLYGVAVEKFYPAVSASKLLADIPQLPASVDAAPRLRRLLDVDFIHMLIVGPSGSGKSTVACHLIDNAPYNATVYVLDPHKSQNEQQGLVWPDRSIVIGDGRNWYDIDSKMIELMAEMNIRYQPKAIFAPVYVVCDEWLTVRKECSHADDFFEKLGSEARKVDMHLIIATISHTVDDLKCSAPVRDNLMQLRLDMALKQRNQGELKQGKSNSTTELVELPGPYYRRTPAPSLVQPVASTPAENCDLIGFDSGPIALGPSEIELQIYALFQAGKSLRAIYTEVYGRPYGGGREVQELRAILGKFGVKFEADNGPPKGDTQGYVAG